MTPLPESVAALFRSLEPGAVPAGEVAAAIG
jgi:hypothetical protein